MPAPAKRDQSRPLSEDEAAHLTELRATAQSAADAFEERVVELLEDGASPTHVGKAVGVSDSSVRRILWRRTKTSKRHKR